MVDYSLDDIFSVMRRKGYAVFTEGDYNTNVVGIRNSRQVTNKFDDTLCLLYKVDGEWVDDRFACTTDPGKGPMVSPPSYGRAVMVPGQYRGAYALGLHKGKEKALVQIKPVAVYRDKNMDLYMDYGNIQWGMFGINIHWSSKTHTSIQVDNWSEGCTVGAGAAEYKKFIEVLEKARSVYGNFFTYTLLERSDFEG